VKPSTRDVIQTLLVTMAAAAVIGVLLALLSYGK